MIIGIGVDLVHQIRIKSLLEKFGQRFKDRVFSPLEQEYAENQPLPYKAYANRFAAKEACAKALGTGFQSGVFLSDIEVVHSPQMQPNLKLYNFALTRFQAIIPIGHKGMLHLSLTDEEPFSQAFVVISSLIIDCGTS